MRNLVSLMMMMMMNRCGGVVGADGGGEGVKSKARRHKGLEGHNNNKGQSSWQGTRSFTLVPAAVVIVLVVVVVVVDLEEVVEVPRFHIRATCTWPSWLFR